MGGAVAPPVVFEVTKQQKNEKKAVTIVSFQHFPRSFQHRSGKNIPQFPQYNIFLRLVCMKQVKKMYILVKTGIFSTDFTARHYKGYRGFKTQC